MQALSAAVANSLNGNVLRGGGHIFTPALSALAAGGKLAHIQPALRIGLMPPAWRLLHVSRKVTPDCLIDSSQELLPEYIEQGAKHDPSSQYAERAGSELHACSSSTSDVALQLSVTSQHLLRWIYL